MISTEDDTHFLPFCEDDFQLPPLPPPSEEDAALTEFYRLQDEREKLLERIRTEQVTPAAAHARLQVCQQAFPASGVKLCLATPWSSAEAATAYMRMPLDIQIECFYLALQLKSRTAERTWNGLCSFCGVFTPLSINEHPFLYCDKCQSKHLWTHREVTMIWAFTEDQTKLIPYCEVPYSHSTSSQRMYATGILESARHWLAPTRQPNTEHVIKESIALRHPQVPECARRLSFIIKETLTRRDLAAKQEAHVNAQQARRAARHKRQGRQETKIAAVAIAPPPLAAAEQASKKNRLSAAGNETTTIYKIRFIGGIPKRQIPRRSNVTMSSLPL